MRKERWGTNKKRCLIPLVFFGADYSGRGRPLTLAQIRRYGWEQDWSFEDIREVLKVLDVPSVEDAYYWGDPRTRKIFSPVEVEKFWKVARRRVRLFRWVPFIKLVGVMNSLAHDNVGRDSDIDFFIVARQGRLWTVRAITLWLLRLLGWRAGKTKYLKVSPDLFLAEDGMDLSRASIPNDYLLAYWAVDFTPLYQPKFFRKFWQANAWLKLKLPVAYRSPLLRPEFETKDGPTLWARLWEKVLGGSWGDTLETSLKQKQLGIIDRNVKKFGQNPLVLVNDQIVKIHFGDDKRNYLNAVVEEFLAEEN
ncbi:MAG: hypothetical protein WC553_02665 [Patescibacteria group bacterium]